ncbi:hypothetical protein J6590_041590 [Homalodisca vitripennis]|nr:hypothetical protein J6590_041590 [Homalodisca vitripennis]
MSSSHCHFPYIVVVSDPSQVLLQLPVTEISHHVLITLPLPIHRGGRVILLRSSSFQSLKSHSCPHHTAHFPYIVVVSDPSQVLLQLPVTEISHQVLITPPYIVVLLQLPVTEASSAILITLPRPIHRGGK